MSPVSEVHIGDHVEITLVSDHMKTSSGIVHYKFPDSGDGWVTVLLKNGDKGRVIDVIDPEESIKQRIMNEGHYTENKKNFFEDVMSNKVIPQTVQSFLNSEGGFLYIGVLDTGTLEERLVGLDQDFEQIQGYKNMTNGEMCDEMERKIMDALDKYLKSNTALGPLVEIKFVQISGVQIAEIKITQSSKPWFFRRLSKNNKPQSFELWLDNKRVGKRVLDDFYIRRGGSKKMLSTHEEVYTYVMDHFKT